jgi:uncharacterized MAPEG superfamily protein
LSGDHLLPRITPNISVLADDDPSMLDDYLASLEKVSRLPVDEVLPGHEYRFTGAAARAERAFRNFLETFPFFAAAVLGVVAAGRTGEATAFGVQLYLWARVLYVPLYLAGVPYVRSLAWAVAMAGLVSVLLPLLH